MHTRYFTVVAGCGSQPKAQALSRSHQSWVGIIDFVLIL